MMLSGIILRQCEYCRRRFHVLLGNHRTICLGCEANNGPHHKTVKRAMRGAERRKKAAA